MFSFTFLLCGISCNPIKQNQRMEIFHLKPNRLTVNDKEEAKDGWFEKEREDFFALNNFDIESEEHKAAVDSFVISYLAKDDFLNTNDKVSLALVFFKYGDGITEKTAHQYDTDYSIHELFAFNKRLIYYDFTSENGYVNTGYYLNGGETIKEEKRTALSVKTK